MWAKTFVWQTGGQGRSFGEETMVPSFQDLQRDKPGWTFAKTYFRSGAFEADREQCRRFSQLRTGYANLDRLQPLYPGLYALGAISSLGKTTFVHQLSDQVAALQHPVLYFSLEQTRFELFSKSLARSLFLQRCTNAQGIFLEQKAKDRSEFLSSVDIRTSPVPPLQELQHAYGAAVQDRLCIVDGTFSLSIEDVRSLTEAFMEETNSTPLVVIDYLQILAPASGTFGDAKTRIDQAVHALKMLQSQYGLVVIVLSSINRQNYLNPVDFESFKESGGIEYTADVVWGLQLSVQSDPAFYRTASGKETNLVERREALNKAKSATPRILDLVCLKNRYGTPGSTVRFQYYPATDCFVPDLSFSSKDEGMFV